MEALCCPTKEGLLRSTLSTSNLIYIIMKAEIQGRVFFPIPLQKRKDSPHKRHIGLMEDILRPWLPYPCIPKPLELIVDANAAEHMWNTAIV